MPDSKPPLHLDAFATNDLPPTSGADESQTLIIKRAAVSTAAETPDARTVEEEFGLPLAQMLGLISYCYAKGVFRSEEIAKLLKADPELKSRFGRKLPDEADLRRFRRRYSAEIEDTLETLYRAERKDESSDTVVLHKNAQERLHTAAWTDNTRR